MIWHNFKIDSCSCARPEPVEGYPRALEEILQQVQDERKSDEKEDC